MQQWILVDVKLVTRKIFVERSNLALVGGCSFITFAVCKQLDGPIIKTLTSNQNVNDLKIADSWCLHINFPRDLVWCFHRCGLKM